jgi:acyl dehydratase
MSLKTFIFEPLTREQIRDYCEASGDWNRIHHDENFAKESGLPGIIAHGMLSMGLATRALHEWGFPLNQLKNLDAKFKDIAKPGDQLTAELLQDSPEIRCRVINQAGVEIVTVSAKI